MPIGGHALSSAPIGGVADSSNAIIGTVGAQLDFFASTATGSTPVLFIGDVSGSWGFSASAVGGYGPGAQVYTFLRFTGSAAGTEPFIGILDTAFPITGAAVGRGHVQGSVAATVGLSAAGLMFGPIFGDALYDAAYEEGIFSVNADGFVSLMGEAVGSYSFTVAATGLAAVGGGAVGSIRFPSSGIGERGVFGGASAAFPFVPSIVAAHGRVGSASASVKFVGTGSGVLGGAGGISVAVPFSGSAVGSATVYPIGSMYAALGIAAYAYGLGQPEEVDVCA